MFYLLIILFVVAHACPPYSVEYDGWCYATMDKCSPSAKFRDGSYHSSCQDSYIRLDTGWELVWCDNQVVQNVIAQHDFGTHVLVCSDGRGFGAKSYIGGAGVEKEWYPDSDGNMNALNKNMDDVLGNSYKVNACTRKVLMRGRKKFLKGLTDLRSLLEQHDLDHFFEKLVNDAGVIEPRNIYDLLNLDNSKLKDLGIQMLWKNRFERVREELDLSDYKFFLHLE